MNEELVREQALQGFMNRLADLRPDLYESAERVHAAT